MECCQKSFCLQAHTSPLATSTPLPTHHLGPQGCLTTRGLREVQGQTKSRRLPSRSLLALLREKRPRAIKDSAVLKPWTVGTAKGTKLHWYKPEFAIFQGAAFCSHRLDSGSWLGANPEAACLAESDSV